MKINKNIILGTTLIIIAAFSLVFIYNYFQSDLLFDSINKTAAFDSDQFLDQIRVQGESPSTYVNYHLGQIIEQGGVDSTVALVMKMLDKDMIDMGGCHTLLHLVGHRAYRHFRRDMERLAQVDWQLCGGAYEHGVEAEIVVEDKDVVENLYRFCQAMRAVSSPGTPCYHGAGHSFMEKSLQTNGFPDIEDSLRRCDNLREPTLKDLSECHKGVFSEYAMMIQGVDGNTGLPLAGGSPVKLAGTHPLDVCQALAEKYQRSCGLQLSRVVAGNDAPTSFQKCLEGSHAMNLQAACIQNMSAIFTGHGLSNANTFTVPEVVYSMASMLRRAYMKGALGEFQAFEQSGTRKDWQAFCRSFKTTEDREYCSNLSSID